MNETQEIPEEEYDEYGKGIDSSEQDQIDAEEMMAQNEMQLPEPDLGGIFGLFGKVMSQKDTTRICNLSKEEMGVLHFTVRGSLYVARLSYIMGHKIFGDFFITQAEILQETSLSKDGFLINTFISSKRYASNGKEKQTEQPELNKKKKEGWKLFSK